jgi:uncharacterized protein
MTTPEIKFSVGDLDAGGKQFTFPLRAAWLRGILEGHEATVTGPDGELDVRASRSGNDVVVHGTLRVQLEVPCARCLTPVPLDIDEVLSLLFVPGRVAPLPVAPKAEAKVETKAPREPRDARDDAKRKKRKRAEEEEYEMSPEDADTLHYDGEVVVLDDVIRDELILETPIFPLCSEDCPGMSAPPGDVPGAGKGSKATTNDAGGGESPATKTDVDPRLLPLLRLRTPRD